MSLLAKVIISLSPPVQIILSVPFPPRTFPVQFRHICAVGEGLGGGGLALPKCHSKRTSFFSLNMVALGGGGCPIPYPLKKTFPQCPGACERTWREHNKTDMYMYLYVKLF